MADKDIVNTLAGSNWSRSAKGFDVADLERGYVDASPEAPLFDGPPDEQPPMPDPHGGMLHRPFWRSDIER